MPKPWMVHAAAWPLGLYGALCLLAFAFQRDLMYFPEKASEAALLARARGLNLQPWRDGGGALIGWRAPHPAGATGRVVVFPGNAGSALGRIAYVRALQSPAVAARWEVVLLEYPGYGARPGAPNEKALVDAGLEALDLLAREAPLPTVLLGESLGSGVAARCAQARPEAAAGLFLATPLTSMADVARVHYPFLPGFLVRDRLDAAKALRGLRAPLAVLVAERDEVIPPRLGRRLFEGYGGPKRLWTVPGAGHNDWDPGPADPVWAEVSAFLRPGV